MSIDKPKPGSNPKDVFAKKKIAVGKLPSSGIFHGAHAMMDGTKKYGAYNWREVDVLATVYVDAAIRHLLQWQEGEEEAQDSGVHHLGHVIACCAILLDAQEIGKLVDDRPTTEGSKALAGRVLERLSGKLDAVRS